MRLQRSLFHFCIFNSGCDFRAPRVTGHRELCLEVNIDARVWLSRLITECRMRALSGESQFYQEENRPCRALALSPSATAKLIQAENANRSRMNRERSVAARAECTSGDVVAADGVVLHEIKNVSLPFAPENPASPPEGEV